MYVIYMLSLVGIRISLEHDFLHCVKLHRASLNCVNSHCVDLLYAWLIVIALICVISTITYVH